MAKWDDRDDRWLVNDLGQSGRNVNGWHWMEYNALPYTKERLAALLSDTTMFDGGNDASTVKTTESLTLTGDCVINQRKGKIIPAYEMSLSLKWKGTDAGGTSFNGDINVPYISEENHDEDPEIQVTVSQSGSDAEKMRGLVVKHGRPLVTKAIAAVVKELHQGTPVRNEQAVNGGGSGNDTVATTAKAQEEATGSGAPAPAEAAPEKQPSSKVNASKRSLEIKETFYASCQDIYSCFTDPTKMRAFTASPASIDARPGGSFSIFGGSIEGEFRDLHPPHTIDMNWRFSSWPDGALSHVIITLEEVSKGAVDLRLKQTDIPDQDRYGNHDVLAMTQSGWRQQVLLRMKQVFGYGA